MSEYWIAAKFWGLAALFIAAALLFLVPPLIKKRTGKEQVERKQINIMLFKDHLAELETDLSNGTITQDQFDEAKHDLERSLLEDVAVEDDQQTSSTLDAIGNKAAVVVAIFVPVAAILFYQYLGGGEISLHPQDAQTAMRSTEGHDGTIEEQIRKLQEHLQTNPDDVEGWTMLARSYYYLKNYQASSDTFSRVAALTKESDPNLLADYADALAMAQGRDMHGKPFELVKKALQLAPFHQKSLWLAGTAAYEEKDYPAALEYWEKLLTMFPKGTDGHMQMLRNIAEVKQLMGQELDPEMIAELQGQQSGEQAGGQTGAEGGNGNSTVSGKVSIDPSLAGSVSPGDTVFIFARAANGPRMPLAILRKQVSDLPLEFMLDDTLAMNPQMALSGYTNVVVSARISKSGNAMPQPGDFVGSTDVVQVGAQQLNIVINQPVGGRSGATTASAQSAAVAGNNSAGNNSANTTSNGANAKVSGNISLAPELAANVSPEDTVFVFARAANGPRMPLAVIKKQVKDLPMAFALDDSMAMNPSMKLSNYADVVVSARISKSGNAIPQAGDLEGRSNIVKVGSRDLNIVINEPVGGGATASAQVTSAQATTAQATTAAANPNARVSGTISLDPDLTARVSPEDTVFVFARAANGPRMPLAIIKKRVKDLPLVFALDDSMAMNPTMKLSSFPEVVVSARISKTGNAMPQSGDLKGSSSVIKVGSQDLKIIIDSAVP